MVLPVNHKPQTSLLHELQLSCNMEFHSYLHQKKRPYIVSSATLIAQLINN